MILEDNSDYLLFLSRIMLALYLSSIYSINSKFKSNHHGVKTRVDFHMKEKI